MKRIVLTFLTIAAISAFGTTTLKSHYALESAVSSEMEFTFSMTGGNCYDCVWIAAQGKITADTPERFLAFVDSPVGKYGHNANVRKYRREIRLHSPGGDLRGALRLGTLFRELGLKTSVRRTGRSYKPADAYAYDAPGECLGACVYALAGGVERRVSDEDRVGLRLLSEERNSAPADGKNETNFAAVLGYLRRMGILAEIAEIARGTVPNQVSILDSDTLRRTNIANMFWRVADWRIESRNRGAVAISDLAYGPKFAVTATVFCRTDQDRRVFLTISLDVSDFLKWNPGPLNIIHGIYVVPKGKHELIHSDLTDRWRWRLGGPQAQNGTIALTIDITEELKEFIASDGFHVKLDAGWVFHRYFPDVVTAIGMDFPISRGAVPTLQQALRKCV